MDLGDLVDLTAIIFLLLGIGIFVAGVFIALIWYTLVVWFFFFDIILIARVGWFMLVGIVLFMFGAICVSIRD